MNKDLHGFLNLYKPGACTSHDVVDLVRRATGQRRVGHTGTLDPLAEGVLVVCMGRATRLAGRLTVADKEYQAELVLGVTTTTDDADGEAVSRRPWAHIKLTDFTEALRSFVGEIAQTPPDFSAVKVGGIAAYRVARAGGRLDMHPRLVRVHEAEVCAWYPPSVWLRVRCSKGTYIRALARDLGEMLGSGAHVRRLLRTRLGPFKAGEAMTLDELQLVSELALLEELLYPSDCVLTGLPATVVGVEKLARMRHGQPWQADSAACNETFRVYSVQGEFLGLAERDATGRWQPRFCVV